MSVARQTPETARAEAGGALADAKRRSGGGRAAAGPLAVLALQRSTGNAAVSALMAGKLRSPGERAVTDIDAALREIRRDEPVIDTVEKGLNAAKAAGVPVDLEGPKPPASALAVVKTGFGPGAVAEKKPVPAPKPVPAVAPLGQGRREGATPRVRAGRTGSDRCRDRCRDGDERWSGRAGAGPRAVDHRKAPGAANATDRRWTAR